MQAQINQNDVNFMQLELLLTEIFFLSGLIIEKKQTDLNTSAAGNIDIGPVTVSEQFRENPRKKMRESTSFIVDFSICASSVYSWSDGIPS